MNAMFAGFAAILIIGVLASFGLDRAGFSTQEIHSSSNVRLP